MKLFTFVDVHADPRVLNHIKTTVKKHKPDALVCCGDISVFEQYLVPTFNKLATLKLPLFIIHGNHDSEYALKKLCSKHKHVFFMHKKTKQFGNFLFIGYGGGGFSHVDPEFEAFGRSIEKKIKDTNAILLTHGPPYKTNLDALYGDHVGCVSFKNFIRKNKTIILAISGHIHETAGAHDNIGKTLLINPGPYGRLIEL